MYVNPFVAGVICTILVEGLMVLVAAILSTKPKQNK